MAAVKSSVGEQIRQLNDARKLVLGDVTYYPTIVQGILPIIGPSSFPELRRWGADFLAEAFATPALPSRDKEILSLLVLENLKAMVENAQEDVQVLRSAIQTAASIYPLVMRWMYVSFHPSPPSLPPSNPDASSSPPSPLPPPPPPKERPGFELRASTRPPLSSTKFELTQGADCYIKNQQFLRHADLGTDDRHQVPNTEHMGRGCVGSQDLLHQVRPTRGASADGCDGC